MFLPKRETKGYKEHRPIANEGDSTALLNISKGTREKICKRTSRPLGPEDGSA